MKKVIPLIVFLMLCISLVSADSLYLTETIQGDNYGQEGIKTHQLGGNTYTFDLIDCFREKESCAIFINGDSTGALIVSDTFNLDGNYYIKIDNITFDFCDNRRFCNRPFDDYDIVEFSIYSRASFCGDNNCNSGESCISCPDDCGECQIVCGDGVCDSDEDCEKDNCCDGEKVDFDDDNYNCGECFNECKKYENCLDGKCKRYCGNGICESDESYENCSRDCEQSLTQINTSQESKSGGEEPVTEQTTKKRCSEGCYSNGKCYGKGNVGIRKDEKVYCDGEEWIPKKDLGEACEANYECRINFCVNSVCKEKVTTPKRVVQNVRVIERKGVISRFISWLARLFG